MKTYKKLIQFIIVKSLYLYFLLLAIPVSAMKEVRTINDGWKFHKGDCKDVFDSTFNYQWETVNLPHTWNTEAYQEKNYYRGVGWYTRTLTIPPSWSNKSIFLKLDGVNKSAELYVNGNKVGEHFGGYTACIFDITHFLCANRINTLAVRVDNSCQNVPPISGDFTFFGGIYRDTWLIAVEAQHFHFNDYGAEGVFITTPQVSKEKGTINMKVEIKNELSTVSVLELSYAIYAPDGILLQKHKEKIKLKGKEVLTVCRESKVISQPQLWTPETPYLYRIETELRDVSTGNLLDYTSHSTGFRWFHFDGKVFFLMVNLINYVEYVVIKIKSLLVQH